MDRRRWLERVEAELAGRGLPAGVRARLLAELRDHLDDLTEGGSMNVEERMGDPVAVAAAVEHRGWVRRHPALVFGLAPVPALLLTVACYVCVFAGLGYALLAAAGFDDSAPPDGTVRIAGDALWYGVAFVPFLAVTAVYGWLAARSGARRWAVVALAQVVILAGVVTVRTTWSDIPEQSTLMVGVGLPLTGWRQAAQMLLPLALGWYALRRRPQPVAVA
jgi:hypothetical protein